MGPAPLGGSCEAGNFLHTGKSPHWWGQGGGELWSLRGEGSGRCEESKAESNQHRGLVLTSTPQPETLARLPTRVDGGWVLRLGLWRSDPGERTGVGCVKTA